MEDNDHRREHPPQWNQTMDTSPQTHAEDDMMFQDQEDHQETRTAHLLYPW